VDDLTDCDEITDYEVGRKALRTFRQSGDFLISLTVEDSQWHDGTCIAECKANDWVDPSSALPQSPDGDHPLPGHKAPHLQCQCGIYGTLQIEYLLDQYPVHAEHCIAVIAAEGLTIIGDKGLRTQAARVIAYWSGTVAQQAAASQFKDAEQYQTVEELLAAYGFDPVPHVS
jgi:hypothetical protein